MFSSARKRSLLLAMCAIALACCLFSMFACIGNIHRQQALDRKVRMRAQTAESLLFFTGELSELMRYTYEIPSRFFVPPAQQTNELLRLADKYHRALARAENNVAQLDAVAWDSTQRAEAWRQARKDWQRLEAWQSGIASEIEAAARTRQVERYPAIYQKVVDHTLELRHALNALQSQVNELAEGVVQQSLARGEEDSLALAQYELSLLFGSILALCALAWQLRPAAYSLREKAMPKA